MFEHSVKVPKHYKAATSILKKVSTEGGSVKTLLYDNKLRHFRTNVLYALLTETIKHGAEIDKIFEETKLLVNEPRLDPWLARILVSELLFGKKELMGTSKPVQTILTYKEQFDKYLADHQDDVKVEGAPKPRYVRINTNLLTTSDAIRHFQDEGFRFIRCTSGGYEDYLKQIQGLSEEDFTQDYHVKTVFVFAPGTRFHDHELYYDNKIILQDKATTLAVHLLAPPPGSVVLDMCAAPGMKTTQAAAFMRNEGKVYAVERNPERYQTLCDFVEKTGCKNVVTLNKDVLEIKRGECDDVEYILLDPSCSGSGMEISVHNYIDQTRLAKLTSLQEKFLKHAMNAFPKAKRIIYSTCSLYPEENERVVTNIVMNSRTKWRVQDVKELLKGQWNNFGSNVYGTIGARCLYAKPEADMTRGFFLAVIDRDQKDLEKSHEKSLDGEGSDVPKKKKKDKHSELIEDTGAYDGERVIDDAEGTADVEVPKKKKKKSKNHDVEVSEDIQDVSQDDTNEIEIPVKRKKNKSKKEIVSEGEVEEQEVKTKKKKDKKHEDGNLEESCETVVEPRTSKKHKSIKSDEVDAESEQPKKKKRKEKLES